jgi:2-polyprenyl-3-methyl-5-hydroxy-6-metoxy-1,4-benzoquinol methylase
MFFNIDDFVRVLVDTVPTPRRILEVGCGDGDVATKLVTAFPDTVYLGIDPAPTAGRRYQGPARATFLPTTLDALAENADDRYDLVLIVDVLHHVPTDERATLVRDAAELLAEGGRLVIKEWERNERSVPYWAGWAADYYVSGDRNVRYMTRDELRDLVRSAAPTLAHQHTASTRPWACNVLHVYRSAV